MPSPEEMSAAPQGMDEHQWRKDTPFPADFKWGAATSSYQIEGAVNADGRGPSIWDTFSHTPGKIDDGDTGDVACDHYNRYADDVAMMQGLGLNAYRFSIAWPRIMPQGTGTVEPRGLAFYDRLVDALLAAGITPYATLYHWDLPQALQDRGGWAATDSVQWFVDYAQTVAEHLGDRVKHWATFNEPFVVAFVGNWQGRHAPGIQHLPTALQVAHHVMLAHGAAVPVIRAAVPDAQVGIVLDLHAYTPKTDSAEDRAASERQRMVHNDWFSEPVFAGRYPAKLAEFLAPEVAEAQIDLDAISAAQVPLDFLGINYYMLNRVAHDPNAGRLQARIVNDPAATITEMDWEVYPEGLYQQLMWLHESYNPPALYITENGAAFPDVLTDGAVHDPLRVQYYHDHLAQVNKAIFAGVPVRGYFAWSLLDNFEWALGYAKRFGIVHVDFATQQRTLKDSAKFYQRVIAAERVVDI